MADQPVKYSKSEVTDFIDLGVKSGNAHLIEGPNRFIVLPDGFHSEALKFDPNPPLTDHVRANVTLTELESFVAYVKRYQNANTVIFSRVATDGASFNAVFDWHAAEKDGATNQVRQAAHRAIYSCPHSIEWRAWSENNAKAKTQDVFAKFLDDNSVDITSPDSATLLEIVQNFEAKIDVDFSSKIVAKSGGKSLTFSENVEAGGRGAAGKLDVPDEIQLNLPVFLGGPLFNMVARVRFRVASGKLSLWYELRRPHTVIESAITAIVSDVAESTGITPLAGSI